MGWVRRTQLATENRMPESNRWPFRRLMVDHLFHGTTRVWWHLESSFKDGGPHTFQLQAGYTGNQNALDWVDVGAPGVNAYYLDDDTTREHAGKRLLTHYRVVMQTPTTKYVSNPQGIWGLLNNKDWNTAREIIRKERLRLGLVSCNGYLLRKMRYGVASTANTDTLTGEIIDSGYRGSWGTAFKVGYHPPVPMDVDFLGQNIIEFRGGADPSRHSSQPTEFVVRVVAFPDIAKEDVWVDGDTDQRWIIHDINIDARIRGVPLIYKVNMRLVPHNNVIYQIPVDPRSYDPKELDEDYAPTTGTGCVRVDHDYGEEDAYRYTAGDCCPISGAQITAFTKEDWDGGARTREHAVATSQTNEGGYWAWAMKLNPGEYVLQFEKPGQYGPDSAALEVLAPEQPAPCPPPALSSISRSSVSSRGYQSSQSSNESSVSSGFGSF